MSISLFPRQMRFVQDSRRFPGYVGGIDYMTFNRWRESKSEFREAIKDAEGRAVVKWLAKIEQAATEGTWQAAAWKLERRYPHDFGKTVQENQITGKDGAPLTITIGERKDGPQ